MIRSIALCFLLVTFKIYAVTLGVIDSGADLEHEDLQNFLWINPNEIPDNNRDEDRNGYQDDVFGWNFAESNNQLIDYSYIGLLNQDIRDFFTTQEKLIRGTANAQDIAWYQTMAQNQDFLKKMSVYGNFMHGTHVAAIARSLAPEAQVLNVKLLPTEVKLPFSILSQVAKQPVNEELTESERSVRDKLLKKGLKALASAQTEGLIEIAYYLHNHGTKVINGSFGTGYNQAKIIVSLAYKGIFFKEPTEEDANTYISYFLQQLSENGQKVVRAAPNTLFVFAAGNDGLNNDIYPAYPASIKADNVISVAATIDNNALAPFSNFGKSSVDLATLGVGILSAVPGNKRLKVSGTSQAAPLVASAATKVFSLNPNLTPLQVKTILSQTADEKAFALNSTKSGGVLNTQRAFSAALLATTMPLERAITQSKIDIAPAATLRMSLRPAQLHSLPMFSAFSLPQ